MAAGVLFRSSGRMRAQTKFPGERGATTNWSPDLRTCCACEPSSMLCFVVLKRSTVMQLNLSFPGTQQPQAQVWAALDEEVRRAVLARLAELIACATKAQLPTQGNDND